jgi:acyl-CoA reductase-like NAD-dependent aldehyde dehydrogenase
MKWLVDNQNVAAKVACRDTGKTRELKLDPISIYCILREIATVIDAALGEILTTCSKMEWLMNYGEAALRPETRRSNLLLSYKKSKVYHEPLGVVAAIVSWNYRSSNFIYL